MYIWQSEKWPKFVFSEKLIAPRVEATLALQKQLIGKANNLLEQGGENSGIQAEMDALIQEAIQTSEIEGETLNVGSVRSSVAKHLGLEQAGLPATTQQTESLVAMLANATSNLQQPMSQQLMCEWQAALFPDASLIKNLNIGELRGEATMQVVSQKGRQEIIHFEAPPKSQLQQELKAFINWFNETQSIDGLSPKHGFARAAIAHLWLITLHPFDDGNGRVSRALTDRALAQQEQTSIRFYSLSAAIEKNRSAYYDVLENTQGCNTETQQTTDNELDVTEWVNWFLNVLGQAIEQGLQRLERVINKTRFWQTHSQTVLSARQIKVLNRLLDNAGEEFEQGINASKYKSITDVSKPTATRDLAEMVSKGCLKQLPGGGRSTRYTINMS